MSDPDCQQLLDPNRIPGHRCPEGFIHYAGQVAPCPSTRELEFTPRSRSGVEHTHTLRSTFPPLSLFISRAGPRPTAGRGFAVKFYDILEKESSDIITWTQSGQAFQVLDYTRFSEEILLKVCVSSFLLVDLVGVPVAVYIG